MERAEEIEELWQQQMNKLGLHSKHDACSLCHMFDVCASKYLCNSCHRSSAGMPQHETCCKGSRRSPWLHDTAKWAFVAPRWTPLWQWVVRIQLEYKHFGQSHTSRTSPNDAQEIATPLSLTCLALKTVFWHPSSRRPSGKLFVACYTPRAQRTAKRPAPKWLSTPIENGSDHFVSLVQVMTSGRLKVSLGK